ncbi:MAG: RNA polymerase sigma factor, partial [Bacteroidetes bacterium]|nr:RNA polymerase sigma factor [Bacteroidota bacterium]
MQSENLITRIKKNDPQAFGDLVESFKDRVYNTCLGMVHHDDDAMDLSQEVFLEVYKSLDGFRGEARLSTWIYRI